MSDITSRVKAIIADKLDVEETEVTPEASFTNDLGADSLDTVELIIESSNIPEAFKAGILLTSPAPVDVDLALIIE